ncbi:hypothetical protein GCM10011371_07330 [Novosphingobium marinum]|uniref:Peptidoglycan/LPS O-acetylase OafA/YrhL n=1 Tax=Novosphingobium marinum TaxID=1514948 RepID=A0A7Y9XTU9_9SPHN|nr:peptidoglycan/LPS O-acetylase OafA/YrhL [Novosphingobium marinum]GGC22209.1 hypothetical protein GCM10011371_07330 [Novosphingobium marinum]
MLPTVLSLMVLTFFALILGAWYLWTRRGARRQAVLMLVLAAVIAANVAIWTVPDSDGTAPLGQDLRE